MDEEPQQHHLCKPAPAPPGFYYVCEECGTPVHKLHFPANCGCGGAPFIFPCAHSALVREVRCG